MEVNLRNNWKLTVSYAILIFINLLFSIKYIDRYIIFGWFFGILIAVFQVFLIVNKNRLNFDKFLIYFYYNFIILLLLFTILSIYFINIDKLNVDRWSVINSFFYELFHGNYPYFAKSHLGNPPGAMPFYFFIAFPFYLLGDLSILSLLGYILFIIFLYKGQKLGDKNKLLLILLLSTMVFLYWEIAVRSNIFTYSYIVLLSLYLYNNINKNRFNKLFFVSSILSGLALSTRGVFIVSYIIIYFSSLIRREITLKKIIGYLLISTFTFLLTFLPFVLFFKESFFLINSFTIQSSAFIPKSYIYWFILISAVMTFLVKDKTDTYFYSGITLFIIIIIYFIYTIINKSFYTSYWGGAGDISYFLFCVPFMFQFLIEYYRKKV
jgi:hypothetical protein